jgi:hypothetical protein
LSTPFMERRSNQPPTQLTGQRLVSVCDRKSMMRRRPHTIDKRAKSLSYVHRSTIFAILIAVLWCGISILALAHSATAAELAVLSNGFSIRHEHRLVIGTTTRLYLSVDDSSFTDVPTADIAGFEKDLSQPVPVVADAHVPTAMPSALARPDAAKSHSSTGSAPPLNQVVDAASATYHLDPDLVNSVIHAESGFNAHAISPKGARGLMQLMPSTANKLGVNNVFDPQANVDGGSRYLRELLERYNFDLVKALAAYNAGPQRVEQYRGVPPFRETQAYVARIVHEYNTKKIAQEKEAKQKQATTQVANKGMNKVPKHTASKQSSTTIAAKVPQ